jgi:hypothetical protein
MKSRYYLYWAVSILALGISGVLYQGLSNSPKKIKIPKPQEAAQQAEKLNPEEITQIEVDEQIRDRLVNLAKQNLKPEPSTWEYPYKNHYQIDLSEFNKDFLVAVLGDDKVYPPLSEPEASQPPLNLPEWSKF